MIPSNCSPADTSLARRRSLMALCAAATPAELDRALAALAPLPRATDTRPPATGLVMIRGRVGGDGAPFNLGEATVTRATVTLDTGETGFSYVLGRDQAKARMAAVIDALGQLPAYDARLDAAFVAPVSARLAAEAGRTGEQTAATKVDFFTLVRGED